MDKDKVVMENKDENPQVASESPSMKNVQTPAPAPPMDSPDNRFSRKEKWLIVAFSSYVGLFSPLTSNIYFPAIPTLSAAFHKSTEAINLTVTLYIVLQGVAPMVWGPLSDNVGRRPISAACIFILCAACLGLALVPTNAYWLLMLLRCLQASGSASTIAVGAGVVGDISSRAERGGFYGVFVMGPTVGPAIGPIIGGALAGSLGWRSIFWFLFICASVCFICIILFQPETLRIILEKGRDQIPIIYKPVIPIIGHNASLSEIGPIPSKPKLSKNPFRIFLHPDVDILLAISALANTIFYGVVASLSSLFVISYPYLTETDLGLCFLGIGGGTILGGLSMGRILDGEYQRFKKQAEARLGSTGDLSKEVNFPLEKARLRLMPIYILLFAACCGGYGWCLQKRVHIAVPLILQFIMGFLGIAIMNSTSTLTIDLLPGQSSAVTACNNLTRCALAAVLVAVIDLMIKALGVQWTYVLLCGLALLMLPLIYIAIRIGPHYRVKRQRMREEEVARLVEAERAEKAA